jgi:hypothetical protein
MQYFDFEKSLGVLEQKGLITAKEPRFAGTGEENETLKCLIQC